MDTDTTEQLSCAGHSCDSPQGSNARGSAALSLRVLPHVQSGSGGKLENSGTPGSVQCCRAQLSLIFLPFPTPGSIHGHGYPASGVPMR